MSIKPIEFQVSIPRTFESSRDQQNLLKRPDIDAQQNAIANKLETEKRLQMVRDSERSEKKDLRNDREKQRQQQEKQDEKELDFEQAARIRDLIFELKKNL